MTHLILIGTLAMAAVSASKAESPADLAWNHFKAMAGEWDGAATDGRKIHHRVQVIAGGSTIMEESWFEGHKGEMMLTTYYKNGEKLMLTHYCVAKNQPRMEATEISADGRRVLFTFVDGANIPSRDKGHMDKALYQFPEKDKFSSQWTWYASGKEQWMEEFRFGRTGGSATKPASGTGRESCCPVE